MKAGFYGLVLCCCAVVPAHAEQDTTVRTGAKANEAQSVENIAAAYTRVIEVVQGKLAVTIEGLQRTALRIEDIRRQINNLQPVRYVTEVVERFDPDDPTASNHYLNSSDDGGDGGCG